MIIKEGITFRNKTYRFLLPLYRYLGETFILKLNSIKKLSIGIHDTLLDGTDISEEKNIYILASDCESRVFQNFLLYLKEENYLRDSYVFDEKNNFVMLIIKIPESFYNTYDKFLEGKYTEMYSEKQTEALFNNPANQKEYKILSLDASIKKDFLNRLNKEYGTSLELEDLENYSEYELPLKSSEEIFNYNKEETYFLTKHFKCKEKEKIKENQDGV
ncbi:MAG: hypothetical protein ACRC0V_08505 [Fusobacteriaceae bacterium]